MSFNMESKAVIGFQDEYSYRSETDRSRAFMTKDHLHVLTPQALYLLTGQKERDLPTGPLAAVAWDASPLVAYRGPQGARLGSLEDAAAAAGAAFGVDLPGGPAMPTTLDFSNDGQHVAAGDLVGNVFVWAVP
jgi:hypothetical protein